MALYTNKYVGALPAGDVFNFGFWVNSPSTVDAVNSNALDWASDFWGNAPTGPYAALCNAGTILETVTTYLIDPATGRATAIASRNIGVAGGAVANPLPQQCSVVCTLRTANPSRSGRGRMFLPAPASGVLSPTGELAVADQSIIVSALSTAFSATMLANGHTPVIWSRKLRLATNITQLGVGTIFDTQTRRTNKLTQDRVFHVI